MLHLTWDKSEQIAARVERPDSTPKDKKYFDLLNPADAEQVATFILRDPHTGRFNLQNARHLIRLFYVLCEEQCKERGMTPEDFGALMTSASFGAAMEAFMEEFGNFIQDPEEKETFKTLMYLADGGRSAVSSEANRALTQKKTALGALITQKIAAEMEPVDALFAKAAEEFGTTASSKSAVLSASNQANKRRGKS